MRRTASTPPELPGYDFVRVLGSGGFSDVFLYEQHLPKRRVAVKVLLTDELTSAHRDAFVAEANLMAQLSAHPYIVSIFHADVASDDRPYFVMEYASGPSLSERYKSEPLSVADVLRIGVRIGGAVATAHEAGILHRDIKPANILTNDYGWPALTDFGISSTLEDEVPTHTITRGGPEPTDTGTSGSGTSVGMSIPWSPPEMFEDDPRPDVRSDVFSLAATLYTLLAGHTPFEVRGRSNGTLDLIGRIERGMITPLTRTDVPRSLIATLTKGMAPAREDRFASAVEFARALQRIELELGYAPTTIDVPNLIVDSSVRASADPSEDETQVRSVATIEAQAPAVEPDTVARAVVQPTPASETDIPDATIVRPKAAPAPASPEEPATPAATDVEAAPRSKGRTLLVWGSVAAAVLVAGGVTAGLMLGGGGREDTAPTEPATASSGQPAITKRVPTPVLAELAATGSTLTYTVVNPDEEAGDFMVWKRLDRGDSAPVQRVSDGQFVIDDYAGGTVCVDVRVIRDGRESADPLEACYPS